MSTNSQTRATDADRDSLYHHTFRDMMIDVVDAGTCCECGSCVLVCPHNVIEYINNKPKQTAKADAPPDYCGISEGVGCDVCAAVCPRLWPRETQLRGALFGNERAYEGVFGVYRHIFVARNREHAWIPGAQDGGIVTALLAWALDQGEIDGAVVSAVGADDEPCFPQPKVATTRAEILASAGSWYTYCPNDLALQEVKERGLRKVALVGVPCQITPLRKMEFVDPSFLVTARKKTKIIARQRDFLKGFAERVAFNIGLFCTEVFRPELMTERIQRDMGIPLTEVAKFNVKGEVLIYKRDGAIETIPLEEAMHDYQRPECRHCGDFSAEMADIACGGVGTDKATIVVIRTRKGEEIWRRFEAAGDVEVMPIEDNKRAWNILLRLARRQSERVPLGAPRSGTARGLPQYSPTAAADAETAPLEPTAEVIAGIEAAYAGAPRPEQPLLDVAGRPIPGDPGDPPAGEKRKSPPPPTPAEGGAPPGWQGRPAGG